MSLSELQNWLVAEALRDDLDKLTVQMVSGEIDNIAVSQKYKRDDSIDWRRLIFAGSVLARSEERAHQEAALRIATAAITLSDRIDIKDAGAVLLGKLSNIRTTKLAIERKLLESDLDERLGITLRLEAQKRLMDNAVLLQSSGEWIGVNDFQQQFWHKAEKHHWLSASAPTASGKTYLIVQWLVDQVMSTNVKVVIYLAPTRALVAEIEDNLKLTIGNSRSAEVFSLPLREKYELAQAGGTRAIFVFTQERMHLFANTVGDFTGVDILIVDEAHKIGDNRRGVVLQDAVERASRDNPHIKVVFISPATQNPENLLLDAPKEASATTVNSDAPTVLQNLIFAEQVPRKPKEWSLSIRRSHGILPLGVLKLSSSPSDMKKRLAFVAAAAGERGGTLVYANIASDAEDIAELISQLLEVGTKIDPELAALADLARSGVHPQYRLVPLVERGVAFHYGNMPSLLRSEIEKLFRTGKIRFLVCTSTLIEGVNLSCRTIVVRGPRKGLGHPMEPHDFWNLAGRAGRWGDEFQGNIICVDPKNTSAWPNGVPIRTRYPIKRESDAIIEQGEALADYIDIRFREEDVSSLTESDRFEQVSSYLLATHIRAGSLISTGLSERHTRDSIERLDKKLIEVASKIEIDISLIARHPGVSAIGMQRLLEAFRQYEGDIENLLPATVDSDDSYDRYVTIMRRINRHVFPAFLPEALITLYALVVVQWLKGFSLAAIIRHNIKYHRDRGRQFKLPTLIRHTMELVEQKARFQAPKYFSAYMDVLKLHLNEIGRSDLIEQDFDIGLQLEYGVSSQTLLSLLELGLSRMSAVALYEKMARDDLSKAGCLQWVRDRKSQFEALGISAIISREIHEKLILQSDAS